MSLLSLIKKKTKKALFTTPSHSGKICITHKFYQWYKCDISETDVYNPKVELEKSQKKAADIYGVKQTAFLTNGSTSGVIAAVLSVCQSGDKVLVWENSHRCHKNAIKLSQAEPIYYDLPYNSNWGIYEPLSVEEYEKLIIQYKPKALIITSPTYEGRVTDVVKLANICKQHNVFLIVDEAHGALYPFSDKLPISAVNYADFTVQSLHKTAGGINPTALLHTNTDINIYEILKLINTTSPSYPMLASIEANINYLNSPKGRKQIDKLITNVNDIKNKLTNLQFYGDDSTKILMKKEGLSGVELSAILFDKYHMEDEISNDKSCMLLTGIGTTTNKLNKLSILSSI